MLIAQQYVDTSVGLYYPFASRSGSRRSSGPAAAQGAERKASKNRSKASNIKRLTICATTESEQPPHNALAAGSWIGS
jgi:hypothetical protein